MKTLDILVILGALAVVAAIWWYTRSKADASGDGGELEEESESGNGETLIAPGGPMSVPIASTRYQVPGGRETVRVRFDA